VTVEIGAKYRLGYEIGELGVSRGIQVRVSRREGFWGLRRLDQKCVWCGKGYLGLCVCWKKASTGVCVCAGRRRAEGLLGHFGETGVVERCRREVFKNEKCLRWCVRSGQVAVATRACAGNDASECQFHFSVKK